MGRNDRHDKEREKKTEQKSSCIPTCQSARARNGLDLSNFIPKLVLG